MNKQLTYLVIGIFFIFLCGAFYEASFTISEWGDLTRGLICAGFVAYAGIIITVFNIE